MTRTDAILDAVRQVLDARRAEVDAALDLRAVRIDVRITPGRWQPRCAVLTLERETVFANATERV